MPAVEVLDEEVEPSIDDAELELLRVRAGTPRFGREIDDRVLPAEAGLDAARRRLREGVLSGPGADRAPALPRSREPDAARPLDRRRGAPEYDAELELEGKVVGRVTSAAPDGDGIVALGYVRVEVPGDAVLRLGTRSVRQLDLPSPRP